MAKSTSCMDIGLVLKIAYLAVLGRGVWSGIPIWRFRTGITPSCQSKDIDVVSVCFLRFGSYEANGVDDGHCIVEEPKWLHEFTAD